MSGGISKVEEYDENGEMVHEIPQVLKDLTSIIGKLFYEPVSFLALQLIINNTIINEEALRVKMKIDTKTMKTLLQQLKDDKIIKEKCTSTTSEESNRSKKVYYMFVNYRALLNVTKYKLDHMRQKIESAGKKEASKAYFQCGKCGTSYETMDIMQLTQSGTDKLICWRCGGEVIEINDNTKDGNSTGNSMAKFNSQMEGIFKLISKLENIRFAPQLLDPPIPEYKEPVETVDDKPIIAPGAKSFSKGDNKRSDMVGKDVSINFDSGEIETANKPKTAVPWLTHNTIENSGVDYSGNNTNATVNGSNETSKFSAISNDKIDTKEYLRKVLGEDDSKVEVRKMSKETEILLRDEPRLQREYDAMFAERKQAFNYFEYMSDEEDDEYNKSKNNEINYCSTTFFVM
uniref:TFIIE domain-containing protein n=1 Tax=Parastrongyloides trichosuri TaxID=131310 RepID=A0A0N4ZMW9_PARTI